MYDIRVVAANGIDLAMTLYQQVGNQVITIARDDDGGDGLNPLLTEELKAGVIYFVDVEELSGDSGSFTLSVAPSASS